MTPLTYRAIFGDIVERFIAEVRDGLHQLAEPSTIDGSPAVAHTEMAWPPDYLAANVVEKS